MELLEPAFGGINLEDVAQPKCFRILDASRERLSIPVWHDDQQGSATVLLAGLQNALRVVGKELGTVKLALIGMGAANVATYRLLKASGIALDRRSPATAPEPSTGEGGTSRRSRTSFPGKWRVCCETNASQVAGGIPGGARGSRCLHRLLGIRS